MNCWPEIPVEFGAFGVIFNIKAHINTYCYCKPKYKSLSLRNFSGQGFPLRTSPCCGVENEQCEKV